LQRQSGQAAVEWVALLLLAALTLGAAAALRGPGEDHGLGSLVAKRIACAAKRTEAAKSCAGRSTSSTEGHALAPVAGEAAPRAPAPAPRVPVWPPAVDAPPSSGRVVDAFRRLRGVSRVARHAWIVCLGYRRWRNEIANPSLPTETVPLDEALAIANTCLNPYAFLTED